ncbi:MAG: hypothetical protein IJ899_13425 [Blautia sp.]|nr:hypothetical protein [Blautia sp.]
MANKMKRSIKTKVRATDTELMTLHRIADENRTKLAEILRQSTLERDFSRFVNTSKEDTKRLGDVMQRFGVVVNDLVAAYPEYKKHFPAMEKTVTSLKAHVDTILLKVEKKREAVAKEVIELMDKRANAEMFDYVDLYERRDHALSINVTEGELKTIRSKADTLGVTISCMLKTNAIQLYKYGKVEVGCDTLDKLSADLDSKLASIILLTETPVTKGDIKEIADILKEAKGLAAKRRAKISVAAGTITKEARAIVKAAV